MRRPLSAFAFMLLFLTLVSALVPAAPARASTVVPAATGFTLTLTSDRTAAEVNDTIGYAIRLNVTAGVLQLAAVNFTVEPDLVVQPPAIATPPDCALTFANATFVAWQCSFLRSGWSYAWSIPVVVATNATIGRYRLATAQAVELAGGPVTPRASQASVWIVTGVLDLTILATPPTTTHPRETIQFNVNVTNFKGANDTANETRLTAHNVSLILEVSPFLAVGAGTPLAYYATVLSPQSSIIVNMTAIVAGNAPADQAVWMNATLLYHDVTNRTIGPKTVTRTLTVNANPIPADFPTALAVLAFALIAILVAVTLIPALGERRLVIDEVFLMHRSGILIQHLTLGPGLRKDDDLVASMFVAIQDFVRDSFHTKATLDEMSFGGRKAAVLRGKDIVLAALISKGRPRYLFPQMKAVERAMERAHGTALADWDGRVSRLDQAGPILQAFLRGGFRWFRGWRRR